MNLEDLRIDIEHILDNQLYLKEKLRQIDEILRGNGDPNKGVVVRLALVEQYHRELKTDRRRNFAFATTAALGFCGTVHYEDAYRGPSDYRTP